MKTLRETCIPRPDVLKGDLEDSIFAADFGHVIEGRAPAVYQDAPTFFHNTHPAMPLKKVITTIFDRLAATDEAGAPVRLSTGFGGGKTHALIALWHLSRNIDQVSLGTELLPGAGRPSKIAVAGIDGEKMGTIIARSHGDITTHSLWGELAYQLGGDEAYNRIASQDSPETAPDSGSIQAFLPKDVPVLILLDELVKYSEKLSTQGQGALLSFLGSLISEIGARKQAVLVISDPASQGAYAAAADKIATLFSTSIAKRLDEELGRKSSDFDPIGNETAQVIVRRLFDYVDLSAAQEASAEYHNLYKRVSQDHPDNLPAEAGTPSYDKRIVDSYPFHPMLIETARDRLGSLQSFQKSRGTLRLFARILRDLWDAHSNIPLVTAGEIDWRSERIQADLLQRLGRDEYKSAVDADVDRHAGQLDNDFSTDIHRRVATALLLESLPLNPAAAMDKKDLTLATLRPTDVGHEASEAMDRLMSVCWHTYKEDGGRKFQFKYEPNVNKLIEEKAETTPIEDARQAVYGLAQQYFGGSTFKLVAYPSSPRSVSDSSDLKLILASDEAFAQSVCDYEDDSEPDAPRPRRFRNAIFAIAPTKAALDEAMTAKRYEMAATELATERKSDRGIRQQLDDLLPALKKRARIRTVRAFNRVVFQGKPSVSLEEKYLVSEDGALQEVQGQKQLKDFLDDKKLIYAPTDAIDADLLIASIVKGSTPSLEHDGAYPANAIHERALASDKLRLMRDVDAVRNAIIKGIECAKLVVRLPNGDVYDAAGCVITTHGRRVRTEKRLTTLKMERDVLVAPSGAQCVVSWTKNDDAATVPPGGPPPVPRPPVQDRITAYDWDTAIQYAAIRPLELLRLKTSSLEAAKALSGLSLPFGAKSLTLTVNASGALKGGGQVHFMVEDVKPNHAMKPMDTAAMLMRAVGDDPDFEATLSLNFDGAIVSDAKTKIEKARSFAIDGTGIEADFGKESK